MSQRKTLDPQMLAQFTGSTHFYRHGLVREVLYTEGVEYVAETAGAYWLLDEIAWAQRYVIPVKAEDFQVWELKVEANQRATLTCGDGDGRELWAKRIEWTDFPEPGIRFYYANWVIHLPSEY
jgi:hypothetical protein